MNDIVELPVRHKLADETVAMLEALLSQQSGETGMMSARGLIVLLPGPDGLLDLIKPLSMSDEHARAIIKAALESLDRC